MWDGAVFQRGGGQPCSVEFHKKGQTRLLLLAQSLREIHRFFVYSAQKEAALERCLFVVQALIKIRISSSLFAKHALCSLFISLAF